MGMSRSLNPKYADDRKTPAGRLTNSELGMVMLAQLAESIERYRPRRNNQANVAEAVQELLRVAKHRARATGQSLGQVLRDHRDALEEGGQKSNLVLQTSRSREKDKPREAMHAAMALQDERRAEHQPSAMMKATARVVESAEEKEDVEHVYEKFPDLRPPSHVATNTSVARRPAPRHKEGGSNPNADFLRLMAPPAPPRKNAPALRLKHNPAGGGGMHNPHRL